MTVSVPITKGLFSFCSCFGFYPNFQLELSCCYYHSGQPIKKTTPLRAKKLIFRVSNISFKTRTALLTITLKQFSLSDSLTHFLFHPDKT